MRRLQIKILGKNNQERGKNFEELIQVILQKLGYKRFKSPVYKTGMEFDIITIHRETGESVLCECKAHKEKIDTGDILKFFGKLCHERSKNPTLKGLFFSLSGFTGTALDNYDELNDIDKEIFKIYTNEDILEFLHSLGLFSSDEEIEKIILSMTDYELDNRYFVYFKSNLYAIQLFKIAGLVRNYVILTGKGELVDNVIRNEISIVDTQLNSLHEIDLRIIEKVIINILDVEKNLEEIAIKIKEKVNDVETALNELIIQEIVIKDEDKKTFHLIQTIETLGKILMRLRDNKSVLTKTKYLDSVINDEFIKFVSNRFRILLKEKEQEQLKRICKIFPSVVERLIFRYTLDFDNAYNQIKSTREISSIEDNNLDNDLVFRFKDIILSHIYDDIKNNQISLTKAGIRAIYKKIELRLTSDEEKLANLDSTSKIYLAVAGGTIQPGQYVVGDVKSVFSMGTACMNLELYEDALKLFDKVIILYDDEYYKILAWFNKGITNMKLQKYQYAIECFNQIENKLKPKDWIDVNITECVRGLTEELKNIEEKIIENTNKKNEIKTFLESIKER